MGLRERMGMALLLLLGGAPAGAVPRPDPYASPTNGQEVLPDLSDPGLDGTITVRCRIPTARRRRLRPRVIFEKGPVVSLVRHDLSIVNGDVQYRPGPGILTVAPDLPLPWGQYTLTLGRELIGGPEDFLSSFTVGPDVYPPVILKTDPPDGGAAGQALERIRIVFNESVDSATVVLGQSVLVEDVGVNPPVAVGGVVVLREGGFLLDFVVDPCFGLPPATTIRVRLLGAGHGTPVRDLLGNALAEDLVLAFATAGDFRLPDPLLVPPPSGAFYATTADSVLAFDVRDAIDGDGMFHPDRIRQVTSANGYGGDFRARLGRPGEAVVDPRRVPETGHSLLYVVDEAAGDVVPVDTATGRVGAGFGGFRAPRDLAIAARTAGDGTVDLAVTDEKRRSFTLITLEGPIGGAVCSDPVIGDSHLRRTTVTPGIPGAVTAFPTTGPPILNMAIPSNLTIALYPPNAPASPYALQLDVPRSPTGLAWAGALSGGDRVCWVTGSGGPRGGGGFIAIERYNDLYFDPLLQFPDSVAVPGVPGPPCPIPGTRRCLILDRSAGSLEEWEFEVTGTGLDAELSLRTNSVIALGDLPTSVATDPTGRLAFVALAGEGKIAVIDLADPEPVAFKIPLPGVRTVFTTVTQ